MMIIELKGKIFEKVTELAEQESLEVYVIGGFVRDKIINRKSKDIDFVIVGSGIDFAQKLAKLLNPKIKVSVFKNFGTAMFKYKDTEYEFVGARKESYQRDSRKPIVENGTIQDDQNRRDFTINALAISMNKASFGNVVDPFGGLKDIEAKIIRTPLDPDITFSDDPLRMMRAIRFATQLNFDIDENSYESIKRNKERIKIISGERITDELNKIILSKQPSIGFNLLFDSGLLEIIFPEMYNLSGIEKNNNVGHKDNFLHTLKVLDNISENTDDLWLRWSAILHDIGKPKTKKFVDNSWTFHNHQIVGANMISGIFRKMKLPLNEKMKFVRKLVEMHHRPISLVTEPITDSAIRRLVFDAGEDLDALLTLVESDITTQKEEKQHRFLTNYQKLRVKIKELEEKDFIRNWQPPIDGNEIMKLLNIAPSKIIGVLKDEIKDAILDEKIENSYEAAYEYLLFLAKKNNLLKDEK
ncbi:MAG: HD domain-containing protein [Bacteroidales bacterium]|nr:HD domain-containing protein [Bacteroidales bacterium]